MTYKSIERWQGYPACDPAECGTELRQHLILGLAVTECDDNDVGIFFPFGLTDCGDIFEREFVKWKDSLS